MNRYALNLMILLLSIVNNSNGMERIAKLLSCMRPQYSEVDSEDPIKLTQREFEIKLSVNPTLNILRPIDKDKNNRWVARLVDQQDRIVEVKEPVDQFVNGLLSMQRFEIIGKHPGIITLKLLEISSDNKTLKTDRIAITISQ